MDRCCVGGLLLVAVSLGGAVKAGEAILERLGEPRTHAIMRHALAPGSGEPENFDLFDCATQRNLSADGIRQAGRAGDMVRAAGVGIDHVWSSMYCRNMDTGARTEAGRCRAQVGPELLWPGQVVQPPPDPGGDRGIGGTSAR